MASQSLPRCNGLALRGSNDLDLHRGRSKGSDLLLHAVGNAGVHGGASRENKEESLGAAEALVADRDDLTVGKLIALLEGRGQGSGLHLLLEVKSNVGELLLDVADNLTLGSRGERVTALGEDLHEVVSQIASS